MSKYSWVLWFPALFACSSEPTLPDPDTTGDTATDEPTTMPELVGSWELTGGENPIDVDVGDLAYLQITEVGVDAGTVAMFGRFPSNDALGCAQGTFARVSASALLVEAGVYASDLLLLDLSGDTMTLTASQGVTATFTRVADIPTEAQCEQASVVGEVGVALRSDGWGRPLFDGTSLLVKSDDGMVYPVSPASGSIGAARPTHGTYDMPIVEDGTNYWAHCACGGSEDVGLVDATGALIASFDTEALGRAIGNRSGYRDGPNIVLHGRGDDGQYWFVTVDITDPLNPVLVSETVAGISYRDLTFHDGAPWGLVNSGLSTAVVRIDASTSRVTRTVEVPDIPVGYDSYGIVSVNGTLTLMARGNTDIRFLELALP